MPYGSLRRLHHGGGTPTERVPILLASDTRELGGGAPSIPKGRLPAQGYVHHRSWKPQAADGRFGLLDPHPPTSVKQSLPCASPTDMRNARSPEDREEDVHTGLRTRPVQRIPAARCVRPGGQLPAWSQGASDALLE